MKKAMLLVVLTALILSSCSSYNYYSLNSNKVDIEKYQTYAWVRGNESKLDDYYKNDIAEDKIIDAASTALNSRGLKYDAKKPDLLIRYTAVVDNKSRTVNDPMYYQYPSRLVPRVAYARGRAYYYYQYMTPFPVYVGSEMRKEEFEEGNIVIDLIDRSTSKVVWRGVAKGEVTNPEKAVNDIPKVVSKIFNKLPLQS
ncbi:DUF4136 domain-containing protein [Desertivirga brevis]|uniref:DUF4136 domain-containing protein n=1 Tax=Desertivirga brevis TaxID=2810310 RepID=UPI001A96F41E|nr:DUF4136 domain-containing protein [Pedobacter sp. SYSU D00873]